ncbi:MAG: type II secretion system GspH family protein [Alphaproteobacteria bacterium]|nr:type II secretion system GspH family protein [Alphaproteobacteria bacterium]
MDYKKTGYAIKDKNDRGFSLVELAVALGVFSTIMVTTLVGIRVYTDNTARDFTRESLVISHAAILEFQARFGRYPCPADITLGPDDAGYGKEDCAAAMANTGRDADGDGNPDRLLIGAVPFLTLTDPDGDPGTIDGIQNSPINARKTFDGWNHKLTYAVTQSMTSIGTYNNGWGIIDIVDEHGTSVLEDPATGHMILVSHGENGRGARTEYGQLVGDCNGAALPPGIITKNETENCNGDVTFMSGLQNQQEIYKNDDRVQFLFSRITVHWRYTGIDQVANTNLGNVGFGTTTPTERLNVNGDVLAKTVEAVSYCGNDGQDCMPSEVIAGNIPAMACPKPGYAVIAIENNEVTCKQVFSDPATDPPDTVTCPDGQAVTGISNITGLICSPWPPP